MIKALEEGVTVEPVVYVNPPVKVAVTPAEVTTTSTTPGLGTAGVVAVIRESSTTTTLAAATPPIVTVDPGAKSLPAIVTGVPPVTGPELGEMELILAPPVPRVRDKFVGGARQKRDSPNIVPTVH